MHCFNGALKTAVYYFLPGKRQFFRKANILYDAGAHTRYPASGARTHARFLVSRAGAPAQTLETLRSTGSKNDKKKAKLVIFDKDGTLICFHTMWSPWAQRLISSIVRETGEEIEQQLCDTLGFCAKSKRVFPGLLAEATAPIIKKELIYVLVQRNIPEEKAAHIINECLLEVDSDSCDESEKSVACSDLKTLFEILRENGVKIAICTSDNRRSTMNTLRNLELTKYIDMVVCGDDPNTHPKPSPHNAWKICGTLDVDPSDVALVGDTKADVGMGSNARLGWNIGVLSGIGDTGELLPEAQYIISSVKDLLPIILPYENWRDCYAYTTNDRILLNRDDRVSAQREATPVLLSDVKVVMFDLHGTIMCLQTKYSDWLIRLTDRIEKLTGLRLAGRIYDALGACPHTHTIKPGLLASSTHQHLRSELVSVLRKAGTCYEEAIVTVNRAWQESADTLLRTKPNLVDQNITAILKQLKASGVKVAIVTSGGRQVVVQDMMQLGLHHYTDMLVCGDDDPDAFQGKSSHIPRLICEELNAELDKTVLVGDTMADIEMGLSAKVGLTVGVLTGAGSYKELVRADDIIGSASEIIRLISHDSKLTDHRSKHSCQRESGTANVITSNQWTSQQNRSYSTTITNYAGSCQNTCFSSWIARNAPAYDYIIVGAGSAGCVLANRLSADPANKVLLLEAGPIDRTWKIQMPAALMYNLCNDKYNWFYHTEPETHMNNRVMYWPRGRVLGGSSSLNAMVYVRGHACDYDRWELEGATGWAYANCLPYFRKSQTHEYGGDDYRGGDGPLHVSRGKTNHELHRTFIEAGQQAGYPLTVDMNGWQQEGVGWMDMTIHNGKRCSAATAYLHPILHRSNLTCITGAVTTRILFNGKRAVGLQYAKDDVTHKVLADRDVILSAGAINSPQILMLSGIGDAYVLRDLGLDVVCDVPGVGRNLQDHLEVYVQQACAKPITLYSAQWKFPHIMVAIGLQWFTSHTGLGASTHLESGGFARSNQVVDHPNVQFHFLPSSVNDHGRKTGPCHAYQVHVGPMRPRSRGYITLRSTNPYQHPKLVANYLSEEQDVVEMRDSVRLARKIFAQKAFDPYRGEELAPGSDVVSDRAIDDFNRKMGDSAYHPSCTCKMGLDSDPMAVVDHETRVRGVSGLRVIDASIMPSIVSGNLNGPTIMLAEKAADIVMCNAPLPPSSVPFWVPMAKDVKR